MNDTTAPQRSAAALAASTAALLGQADTLVRLGNGLSLLALLALLLAPLSPGARLAWLLVLPAGAAQLWFGLHAGYDAAIFRGWARAWQDPQARPDADLAAFDSALADLGLRRADPAIPRTLPERARSARRLLRAQLVCLGLQLPGVLAGLLLGGLAR